MRIPLSEIWNFTALLDKGEERSLRFALRAGSAQIEQIDISTIEALRSSNEYDTELLPSIFTFREILWQPDVYTEAKMCLPSLRVLSAYCNEEADKYHTSGYPLESVYAHLLTQLSSACDEVINALEKKKIMASQALGIFRTRTFPIIKFFIGHPKNRKDYHKDAINRLNYAVKIMITELHGKYTELQDPYWEVTLDESIIKNGSTAVEHVNIEPETEKK